MIILILLLLPQPLTSSGGNTTLLRKTDVDVVKPEEVKAFELGYRSFINKTSIDINGYYNIYNNFIGNLNVVAPLYGLAQNNPTLGNPNLAVFPTDPGSQSVHALRTGNTRTFQLYTNTDLEIKSLGFGIRLSKKSIPRF